MPSVLRRDASRRLSARRDGERQRCLQLRDHVFARRRHCDAASGRCLRALPARRAHRRAKHAGGELLPRSGGRRPAWRCVPAATATRGTTFPLRMAGRPVARTGARPPAAGAALPRISPSPNKHFALRAQRLHQAVGMARAAAGLHGLFIGTQRLLDFAALQMNMRDPHQVEGAQDRPQVPLRDLIRPLQMCASHCSRSPCERQMLASMCRV